MFGPKYSQEELVRIKEITKEFYLKLYNGKFTRLIQPHGIPENQKIHHLREKSYVEQFFEEMKSPKYEKVFEREIKILDIILNCNVVPENIRRLAEMGFPFRQGIIPSYSNGVAKPGDTEEDFINFDNIYRIHEI